MSAIFEPKEKRVKPVIKWAGGKAGLIDKLAPFFPSQCYQYFEPFFGGGAVFFSLNPTSYAFATLNDLNEELITTYLSVRNYPNSLMRTINALGTQYSEDFYYEVRKTDIPENDPVGRAARLIFLNKTGYNGLYRQNKKGKFNCPFGHRKKCPELYSSKNLQAVKSRLDPTRVTLTTMDFEKQIGFAEKGDLIYCDPPYAPLSATSSFRSYMGNGFSPEDQERLRDACAAAANRGAHVIISNSTAPLILDLYAKWSINVIKARRAINSKSDKRGEIDEVVIVMKP